MQSIQSTADLIKSLCDKKGVSVNKMLIDSGAGARTYYNMLAGSFPSTDKIAKIADYFKVSVDYLLGRTEYPEINNGQFEYNGVKQSGEVIDTADGYIFKGKA